MIKFELGTFHVIKDNPNLALGPINFTCKEYYGVEIFSVNLKRIPNSIDLLDGQKILVPGLCGGYFEMLYSGEAISQTASGKMGAFIERSKDERDCWIAVSLFNLDVIKKVDLDA